MQSSSLSAVQGSVASLLGFTADAEEQDAAAEAQRTSAQGYELEIDAYGRAVSSAEYNAMLEGVATDIKALQQEREVNRSIGATRAASAAAGFKDSGSTVDLLRSTLQEGYLTQALTRTQGALRQSGYIEQAQAAAMQRDAAGIARQSALDTATAQEEAASLSRANAANLTAALTEYLGEYGTDDETDLVTSVLTGTTTAGDLTTDNTGNELTVGAFNQGGGQKRSTPGRRERVASLTGGV